MVQKKNRKKRHLQIKKRKQEREKHMCVAIREPASISKDDWTKGRGFNERAKQNKTNT